MLGCNCQPYKPLDLAAILMGEGDAGERPALDGCLAVFLMAIRWHTILQSITRFRCLLS